MPGIELPRSADPTQTDHCVGNFLVSVASDLDDRSSSVLDTEIVAIDRELQRLTEDLARGRADMAQAVEKSAALARAQHGGSNTDEDAPFRLLWTESAVPQFDYALKSPSKTADAQNDATQNDPSAWTGLWHNRLPEITPGHKMVKQITTQLFRLPLEATEERDGLLALLAPMLGPAQLWQLAARWREDHAAAISGPARPESLLGSGGGAMVAVWLAGALDRALRWLNDDLPLLRAFSSTMNSERAAASPEPEALLDQICLRRVYDAFHAAMAALQRAWQQIGGGGKTDASERADAAAVVAVAASDCCWRLRRFGESVLATTRSLAPRLSDNFATEETEQTGLTTGPAEEGRGLINAQWVIVGTHIDKHGSWLAEIWEEALEQRCKESLATEAAVLRGRRGESYPTTILPFAATDADQGSKEDHVDRQSCPPRIATSCAEWVALASKLTLGDQNFCRYGNEWTPPPTVLVSVVAAVVSGLEQLCARWELIAEAVPQNAGRNQLLVAVGSAEYCGLMVATLQRAELSAVNAATSTTSMARSNCAAMGLLKSGDGRGRRSRSPSPEQMTEQIDPVRATVCHLLTRAVASVSAVRVRLVHRLMELEIRMCRGYILPDLDQEERWLSHRPFLPLPDDTEARCSYAIPMWAFFMRSLSHDLYEGTTPFCHAAVLGAVAVESFTSLAVRYTTLIFSRARQRTFENDILAAISVARAVSNEMLPAAEPAAEPWVPLTYGPLACREHVDRLSVHMLRCLAVRCAPLTILNDFLAEWLEPGRPDPRAPPRNEPCSIAAPPSLWQRTGAPKSIAENMQNRPQGNVELGSGFDPLTAMGELAGFGDFGSAWDLRGFDWFNRVDFEWGKLLRLPPLRRTSLLDVSCESNLQAQTRPDDTLHAVQQSGQRDTPSITMNSIAFDDFDIDVYLGMCRRRTELREGDYPPLTESEQEQKGKFIELLGRLGEVAGQRVTAPQPAPELVFKKAFSSDDDY